MGPAPNHYGYLKCFISENQKVPISDTVAFILKHIPISHANIDDHLRKTVDDIIHLLTKTPTLISPNGPSSATRRF